MLQKEKGTLMAHLAVIAANLIFGATFSIVKIITPAFIQPLSLNVVRIGVSLLLFWLLFLFKPTDPGIQKKHIPRFITCALTGVAINQIFYIKGVSLTSPIHASLLMLSTPILITVIAAWLLKERVTFLKLLGLALGISGAVVLVLQKDNSASGSDILLGDLLVFLNAASYAFYLVLVKPLMEAYSPVKIIRWIFTFGALFIIPIGWNDFSHTDWTALTPKAWAALSFIVVGATFLAYLFNMYGVRYLGASVTGSYIYSQPVFAALIAMIFMGEALTPYKILSALLIFTGVFLATFRKKTDA